jgi:hypothetical protein
VIEAVVAGGFVDFEITWCGDLYSGAPQSSSAAKYGTIGINFRARKAMTEQELNDALAALYCEMRRARGAIGEVVVLGGTQEFATARCTAGDEPLEAGRIVWAGWRRRNRRQ